MKVLNFGSLNIDHVYQVDRFVRPGETISSSDYQVFAGGKGNNQSIALGRAGARVYHAGKIGRDGRWLRDGLIESQVDASLVEISDAPTGHAIIQVSSAGENAIIIYGGANRRIGPDDIERALTRFSPGDCLLLQNEINAVADIMERAAQKGLTIVFNPAPMTMEVARYPLERVDTFIVNEIEGFELTGGENPEEITARMLLRFPEAKIVLTLGAKGVLYAEGETRIQVEAEKVKPVDTTAAGDTFIGYYLAERLKGESPDAAIKTACRAAAYCVTRPGATSAIPYPKDLENLF